MYRMRPVPVVRRPLAFSPQLYFLVFFEGYPQEEQVFFWMWKETFPHRRQVVWDLLCRFPNEVVPLVCSGNKSHDLATKETCEIMISDGKWLKLQRTVPRNCPISQLPQSIQRVNWLHCRYPIRQSPSRDVYCIRDASRRRYSNDPGENYQPCYLVPCYRQSHCCALLSCCVDGSWLISIMD